MVKKLPGGEALWVNDIPPELQRTPDIVWLSWLTSLFTVARGSGTIYWQTGVVVPIFQRVL